MDRCGRFIVIDGIDGAGKTTQAHLLVAWAAGQGLRPHLTTEPSRGPVGRLLRRILRAQLDPAADGAAHGGFDEATLTLLFAADRLDHLHTEVQPHLARGDLVISDRYLLSSLAYQGSAVEPDWLLAVNAPALPPDLTLLLDAPPEVCVERIAARGGAAERYDRVGLLRTIRQRFFDTADLLRARRQQVIVIAAAGTAAVVHQRVVQAVQPLLRAED